MTPYHELHKKKEELSEILDDHQVILQKMDQDVLRREIIFLHLVQQFYAYNSARNGCM